MGTANRSFVRLLGQIFNRPNIQSLDHPMTHSADRPISQSSGSSPKAESLPGEVTRWQRFLVWLLGGLSAVVVRLIGAGLQWELHGWEHWTAAEALGKRIVYTFWHSEIFAATWFWRKRGIVVMSGYNFDARLTARVIAKHGYEIARGSASRGAARALVGMVRAIQRGHDAAFTIDGPRGPRYQAKPGAVMLAKATGAAILCFHIRPAHAWVFTKSWDRSEIPRPFSRAAVFIAPPITVSRDADDAELTLKLNEVQTALEDLVRRGDEWQKRIQSSTH
jgi:lysophospholipid acyltransferase (LPLAT)-like uncharacterized protein